MYMYYAQYCTSHVRICTYYITYVTTCRASEASPILVLNIAIYMYMHTSRYLLFERNIAHELNKCILYSYTVQLRHDTETPEVRATQMGTREVTQAHLQQLTWSFCLYLVKQEFL